MHLQRNFSVFCPQFWINPLMCAACGHRSTAAAAEVLKVKGVRALSFNIRCFFLQKVMAFTPDLMLIF